MPESSSNLISLDPGLGFGILRRSTSSIPGVMRRGDETYISLSSFRRRLESSRSLIFWTPAFAGVTDELNQGFPK